MISSFRLYSVLFHYVCAVIDHLSTTLLCSHSPPLSHFLEKTRPLEHSQYISPAKNPHLRIPTSPPSPNGRNKDRREEEELTVVELLIRKDFGSCCADSSSAGVVWYISGLVHFSGLPDPPSPRPLLLRTPHWRLPVLSLCPGEELALLPLPGAAAVERVCRTRTRRSETRRCRLVTAGAPRARCGMAGVGSSTGRAAERASRAHAGLHLPRPNIAVSGTLKSHVKMSAGGREIRHRG